MAPSRLETLLRSLREKATIKGDLTGKRGSHNLTVVAGGEGLPIMCLDGGKTVCHDESKSPAAVLGGAGQKNSLLRENERD